MDDPFRANLAILCSYHPSIAEVCRKLDFNRQQFNKYLAGQSRPSRSNLRRICDFFGVTEAEMLLETAQFEQLVAVRRRPLTDETMNEPLRRVEKLYRASQNLDKYVGSYFRYFYSFGNAGKIIRSFATIAKHDGRYYWKNVEILRDLETGRNVGVNKYEGVVFFLADRIYVVEHESLQQSSVTQVTLYPSYRTRVERLLGVQTGGPTRRGRRPGASKVLLDYLGRDVDPRKALATCGLLDPADPSLGADIAGQIVNTITPPSFVLEVEEP